MKNNYLVYKFFSFEEWGGMINLSYLKIKRCVIQNEKQYLFCSSKRSEVVFRY